MGNSNKSQARQLLRQIAKAKKAIIKVQVPLWERLEELHKTMAKTAGVWVGCGQGLVEPPTEPITWGCPHVIFVPAGHHLPKGWGWGCHYYHHERYDFYCPEHAYELYDFPAIERWQCTPKAVLDVFRYDHRRRWCEYGGY